MTYIIDPHGYFEQRGEAHFFHAVASIFLVAGFSAFELLAGAIKISSQGENESLVKVVQYMTDGSFFYSFVSVFIKWGVITVIVYGFIMWFGMTGVDSYTVLNLVGVGFTPIVFSSTLDMFLSIYYSFFTNVVPTAVAIRPISSGVYSVWIAIISIIFYVLTLIWAVHIWSGGIHQIGGVTPKKSTLISTLIAIGLLTERLVVIIA
jgi:hypothetical protein